MAYDVGKIWICTGVLSAVGYNGALKNYSRRPHRSQLQMQHRLCAQDFVVRFQKSMHRRLLDLDLPGSRKLTQVEEKEGGERRCRTKQIASLWAWKATTSIAPKDLFTGAVTLLYCKII